LFPFYIIVGLKHEVKTANPNKKTGILQIKFNLLQLGIIYAVATNPKELKNNPIIKFVIILIKR